MQRLRLAAVVGILLLAGAPSPAAAVSDDAFLALHAVSAYAGLIDEPTPGALSAQVQATDDAPAGPLHGQVVFTVADLSGGRPPQSIHANFSADVPAPGPGRGAFWQDVEAEWTPEPGLYNVTAELWADGADHAWDSAWTWQAAGHLPHLGAGWGHVAFPAAAAFDLDGDGVDDAWLADNATGAPVERPLDAYDSVRMGSLLASWSPVCGRGLELDLGGGDDAPATRVRVAQEIVAKLAPGDSPLRMDTQAFGGAPPPPVGGAYETTVGATFYGSRSDGVSFQHACAPAPPRGPDTWGDGYRTIANVTHWDLDGDGAMDVRFWHSDATTPDQARNETVAERRQEEVVLVAQARVEKRQTVHRLTFDLHRPDDGHAGAWVEIQDADRLFRALLQPGPGTRLSYSLSLPSTESFVEQDGNTTWAWIGHFSTQTLAARYDPVAVAHERPPERPPRTEQTAKSPIPLGPIGLLAVALAAMAIRRRG